MRLQAKYLFKPAVLRGGYFTSLHISLLGAGKGETPLTPEPILKSWRSQNYGH